MKNKTYKEEINTKERGSKRYQERLAEEKEAEDQIREFEEQEEDAIDNDKPNYHP
jgi:hypothetical protein